MAAMLYRYAEYKGTVSNTEGMSVREFSDYDSISSWAQTPIQWAMNNCILSGNDDRPAVKCHPRQGCEDACGANAGNGEMINTSFYSIK